ncbi:hypothetical protein BGW80DRAFT_747608 [Lactifluus volemus]|nr:hypothetical protein BGW80DRAFT_747608 [Lactifluus volemus]
MTVESARARRWSSFPRLPIPAHPPSTTLPLPIQLLSLCQLSLPHHHHFDLIGSSSLAYDCHRPRCMACLC